MFLPLVVFLSILYFLSKEIFYEKNDKAAVETIKISVAENRFEHNTWEALNRRKNSCQYFDNC